MRRINVVFAVAVCSLSLVSTAAPADAWVIKAARWALGIGKSAPKVAPLAIAPVARSSLASKVFTFANVTVTGVVLYDVVTGSGYALAAEPEVQEQVAGDIARLHSEGSRSYYPLVCTFPDGQIGPVPETFQTCPWDGRPPSRGTTNLSWD